MVRPIDPSRYIQGPPCRQCGTTLRYPKGTCVECTRRRNATKNEKQPADVLRPKAPKIGTRGGKVYTTWAGAAAAPISQSKLSNALEGYRRSPGARERSAHLDHLLRARFAALLDEKPQETRRVPTAGELHRQQLPIGPPEKPPERYDAERPMRHAQNAALRKAVKRILPSLPDIIAIPDVRARLSEVAPDVVEPISRTRLTMAISDALASLGVKHHNRTHTTGNLRLYVVRKHSHYRPMRPFEVVAAHAAMVKGGNRSGGPTVAVQPPSARRAVGQRGAGSLNAGPGRPRKTRHSPQTESKGPPTLPPLRNTSLAAT
jgi:hypothetical protein